MDYGYVPGIELTTTDAGIMTGVMAFMGAYFLVVLLVAIFFIVCLWKIFVKAGKPGWAAIIPIYNTIVLLEIVGRPIWWVLLFFLSVIPFVGWIGTIVVTVIVTLDLAKSFGKSVGFAIMLILLPIVGYPMLAFSQDKYIGPSVSGKTTPEAPTQ